MTDQFGRIRAVMTRYLEGDRAFRWVLLIIAALFLLQDGFYTLDGWAHMANARLMLAKWMGDPALVGFVHFNPEPVPNWFGHAMLAALMAVLPALWAEKVHWVLLVLAMAIGGQRFVQAWSGRTDLRVLLLLPIFLGHLFVLGFYNFLWGVAASLWCAAWWCATKDEHWSRWPKLLLCTVLVWTCHGSCVPFFFALIGAISVADRRPVSIRRLLLTGLMFLPAFFALWFFNAHQQQNWSGLALSELAHRLARLDWSVWYDHSRERPITVALGAALLLGIVAAWLERGKQKGRRGWPLPALGSSLLIAYFLIPDDTGYASFISLRLASLSALVFALWICTVPSFRPWVSMVVGGLALFVLSGKVVIGAREARQACDHRDVLLRAATHLRSGDVVLPIWRDDRWLYQHRADILGLGAPMRLLENSECNKRYFPLVWDDALPNAFRRVAFYEDGCLQGILDHVRRGEEPAVDHLVFMGNRLDSTECGVRGALELADSLGYRISFQEKDVIVRSRP